MPREALSEVVGNRINASWWSPGVCPPCHLDMGPNIVTSSKVSRETSNSLRLGIAALKDNLTSQWFDKLEVHFSLLIKPAIQGYTVITSLVPFIFWLYLSSTWCPFYKVVLLSFVPLEHWLLWYYSSQQEEGSEEDKRGIATTLSVLGAFLEIQVTNSPLMTS